MIDGNLDLTWDQLQECASSFYEWFSETEGYGHREERFWNAIHYSNDSEAYAFLKVAWRLGYEAGLQSKIKV